MPDGMHLKDLAGASLVDHIKAEVSKMGPPVMFVSLECTAWTGSARWRLTVQLYQVGRLVEIVGDDQADVERKALEWLHAQQRRSAA